MIEFEIPHFDFSFLEPQSQAENHAEPSGEPRRAKRRTTQVVELSEKYEYRRAFSETKLLDACGKFDFKPGYSYHFITAGDVDSLSFLKAVLRQQKCEHLLCSTWCMAAEDIFQLREWVDGGVIGELDIYVGEIFPTSYRIEWGMLNEMRAKGQISRLVCFRNHSKIYAGIGEKFAFAIETSANINTNPRTEQGVITIDEKLYRFYKEYFDGINSFVKNEQ